jgi:hypothetical protein
VTLWKTRVLVEEGCRNLIGRWRRHVIAAVLLSCTLALAAGIEMAETSDAIDELAEQRAHGSLVLIVAPNIPEASPISSERCALIGQMDHVERSGGLTPADSIEFDQAPGTPFRRYEGTGDIVAVLDPDALSAPGDPPEIWIGQRASEQLGVPNGGRLNVAGAARTVAVADPHLRSEIHDSMILEIRPAQQVQECWFELKVGTSILDATAATKYLLGSASLDHSVAPLLSPDVDVATRFEERPSRLLVALAVLSGVAVAGFHAITTLRETALYRVLGAGRRGAWLIAVTEAVLVAQTAALAAFSIALWWQGGTGILRGLSVIALSTGSCIAAILLMQTLALLARPVDQLKNRAA